MGVDACGDTGIGVKIKRPLFLIKQGPFAICFYY